MAVTEQTINSDIQKAKSEYRVECLEMVDGKIKADFVIEKNMQNQWNDNSQLPDGEKYDYTRMDKIFDTWQGFTDYAKVFFNKNK